MKDETPTRETAPAESAPRVRPRSRRMVSTGMLVAAVGTLGVGVTLPSLVSNAEALNIAAVSGFAVVAVVGAALIQRGRSVRAGAPVTEVEEAVPHETVETVVTPLGRRVRYPAEFVVGELLPPPSQTQALRIPSPFAPPLPPPPFGANEERSPLPVRVPDDPSALAPPRPSIDTTAVEMPVVIEPLTPVVEEVVVEEPVVEEPVVEESVVELSPVVDEPVVMAPVVEAPALAPLLPEPVAVDEPLVALAATPSDADHTPVDDVPSEIPVDAVVDESLLVPDTEQVEASMSAVLHDTGNRALDQYRQWVLEQALGETAFHTLDIEANQRDMFMLSSCGVATLLAWLHDQYRATYTVDTWIDEILPGQGIVIDDRELAVELLIAAALYAGGIHTAPTARLREYRADELVTAMATMHVGLLRLYCGIGHRHPAAIVSHQFDGTPFAD